MTGATRWGEVKARLAEALSYPAGPRAMFLAGLDPEVRAEVESLLAVEAQADAFLEAPAVGEVRALRSIADALGETDPLLGTRVGPWRIAGRLGEGAMGTVYLAYRDDGLFERAVALKVARIERVRPGAGADELRRRFSDERRLLARLDHPGLAALHDGGTLPDGRPWLAMALVSGASITDHARLCGLGVRARVRLLLQALDAVGYAHRHLVVHRDLKPEHLVVVHDGEGAERVRILDFGVATALGAADPERLGGAPDAGPLTAAYAAPEQLRPEAGDAVTVSADVFALGVVLFELLADRKPERLPDGRVAERVAAAAPPERRRHVRGDLDAVVARALAADPADRYASAEALAADLRRVLERRPVEAVAPTVRYRVARAVQRHRLRSAAAVVAVLVAVAAVGYHTQRVTQERNAAQREAVRASATASFLGEVFQTYNPDAEVGDRVTARDLLDARVERLMAEPDDAAFAKGPLLAAAARAYAGLALYDRARPVAEAAVEHLRRTPDADLSALVDALDVLVDLTIWTEDYGAARALAEEAAGVAAAARDPVLEARAWLLQGRVVSVADGRHRAVPIVARAVDQLRAHARPDALELAAALHDLGTTYLRDGAPGRALPALRQALAIRRARLGPRHPELAVTLTMLGTAQLDSADPDAAEATLLQADRIFAATLDRSHPESATAVMGLGHVARMRGLHGRAEDHYRDGLEIRQRLLGESHQAVAASHNRLALNRRLMGDLDGAAAHYEEARRVLDRSFPGGHPRTAVQLMALGKIHREQGRTADAARLFRQALEMRERVSPGEPAFLARSQLYLADAAETLGRRDEAARLFGAARAALADEGGAPDGPRIAELVADLGRRLAVGPTDARPGTLSARPSMDGS